MKKLKIKSASSHPHPHPLRRPVPTPYFNPLFYFSESPLRGRSIKREVGVRTNYDLWISTYLMFSLCRQFCKMKFFNKLLEIVFFSSFFAKLNLLCKCLILKVCRLDSILGRWEGRGGIFNLLTFNFYVSKILMDN